jgi:DNA (cytosine-5)-methyltransferase 1
MSGLTSLEICAGGGGQALGVESAGFSHVGLVEIDKHACATLRQNRVMWNVIEGDLLNFDASNFRGVDLLAGGVPCPPFSKAGKQLGGSDERNLFPAAIRLVDECRPRAVMLENVRGLLDPVFAAYRTSIEDQLRKLGYVAEWRLLSASDFGVAQLRPRVVLVAPRKDLVEYFEWPEPSPERPPTVGDLLYEQMASRGWKGAESWREKANSIAPTIVGGSKKHGGPDLGPTRAKRAWASLGVDGHGIANAAPDPDFDGTPRLTVEMVALLQGFPSNWKFSGRKTNSYRQVGNAFPPPVAEAVANKIHQCLSGVADRRRRVGQILLPFRAAKAHLLNSTD